MAESESRQQRALNALLRETNGHKLSDAEKRDSEWYQKKICKERLRETVSELSKAEYCRLSGLHQNSLTHQITRLRLPIDGKVDLSAVLRRHHEIHNESGSSADRPRVSDPEKQLKIEQLEKKNALLDMDIRQRRGDFIARTELALKMERLIGRITAIGSALGKRFGADAQKLLNQGLESIEADFDDQPL